MKLRAFGFCVLLVAVSYANSIPNRFIQDDHQIIESNENIRSIAPLQFLGESYWPKSITGGTYRPLTILSFSIEYALWQSWAPGFRMTNLALHAMNGWLVFVLANALAGARPAWAAAAVYLVHPVHTEAVVGIVGRSELLAGGLFFAAWLMFRNGRTGWAALLFFLSLLGKENAIMLPAVALLDVLLLGGKRVNEFSAGGAPECSPGREAAGRFVHTFRAEWRRFAVLGAVAAVYLVLRFSVLGGLGVPVRNQYLGGTPLLERWLTSGRVFLKYFQLAAAPIDVAGSYEFNSIPMATARSWDAWIGLAMIAALVVMAVALRKGKPALSFGILLFFVALIPVSNWVMPLTILMAERLLYTPLFGVALAAGVLWSAIPSERARRLTGAGVLGVAVLLCASHNMIWADEFTFYRNMVRVVPGNAAARVGYGYELQTRGRLTEARREFEQALRIDPENPAVLAHLAAFIVQTSPQGCGEARPLLERAIRNRPNHWQSHWVLANCATFEGQREKANELYRIAVDNAPAPDPSLLFTWGLNLETLGQRGAAIALYRRAAEISPSDSEIQRRLASLSSR